MAASRRWTELEATVLGVVWAHQPCTPYQVRRDFTDSPSPHWSGSAGAIYPLMARLEAAGLLRSEAHATGARRSRRYRLTPAGRRALARWVRPASPDLVVGVPPDPLRTRIAFMGVLPPAEQVAFLREVESGLIDSVAEEAHFVERGVADGANFELMARGAADMQRARLAWVRELLRRMDGSAGRVPRPAAAGRRPLPVQSSRRPKA
jgi:DNA-binding PadR family transcriptional regulator